MADIGRDTETLAANITGGPGWRARVNAWAEALFGSRSPFGTAAYTDSGTAQGNVVVTNENGVIPVSVLPSSSGPQGLRSVEIIQKAGNPERFLEADSLRLDVQNVGGVLRVQLDYRQVAAEYTPPVTVVTPTRTMTGLDRSFEIRIGETYDDEIFLTAGATLTVTPQAASIASVQVLGPTRLKDGRGRWVIRHTGIASGSTTGVVRATWTNPGETQTDHYGVRVLRRSTDPLPGLKITGLQLEPGLRVGGSPVVDRFTVSPVDAIVSIATSPDELIAQGVLSGSAFDARGRGSVTWAAVGSGYTTAVIRVARRTDPTDYIDQLVELWVEGQGSQRPSISGLRGTLAIGAVRGVTYDDFTAGPNITRFSSVSSPPGIVHALVGLPRGNTYRLAVQALKLGRTTITVVAHNKAGSIQKKVQVIVGASGGTDPVDPGDNV